MLGRTVNLLSRAGWAQLLLQWGNLCCASNGRLYPLLYLYTYSLGAMLRHRTSADLSPILFALVVGAGPKL